MPNTSPLIVTYVNRVRSCQGARFRLDDFARRKARKIPIQESRGWGRGTLIQP